MSIERMSGFRKTENRDVINNRYLLETPVVGISAGFVSGIIISSVVGVINFELGIGIIIPLTICSSVIGGVGTFLREIRLRRAISMQKEQQSQYFPVTE